MQQSKSWKPCSLAATLPLTDIWSAVWASVCYGLDLQTASNKGFDALWRGELQVEINATQAKSVAFRSEPRHIIIIRILRDGTFEEIYNGPGSIVWKEFSGRALPSNGQYQISIVRLRELRNL